MKTIKSCIIVFSLILLGSINFTALNVSAKATNQNSQQGIIGYSKISSGYNHACALNTDGNLKCWGSNTYGQIGDETYQFIARSTPGSVPGLGDEFITSFKAGGYNSCIITQDGALKCWGDNNWKQLGNPEFDSWAYGTPVQVKGLTENIIRVGIGNGFICALNNSGDVYCWGLDYSTNELIINEEPVLVSSDYSFISLSVNGGHACAITTNNELACWGLGGWGQLANGTNENEISPNIVEGLSSVSIIGLGDLHTCAVGKSAEIEPEKLWCWGSNSSGQLGISAGDDPSLPSEVVGITGEVLQIAGGYEHTCAIVRESEINNVYCWGSNTEGQLGTGTTQNSIQPTLVPGTQGAVQISAGKSHTTILKGSGIIQSWGANKEGQLGNGALFRRQLPIHLQNIEQPIKKIVSGELHTCALTQSGSVLCWGGNQYGQVGNESYEFTPEPVEIIGTGINDIFTGPYHTCALLDTEEVKCWGNNSSGILGTGDPNEKLNTPKFVVYENFGRLNGVKQIGCGNGYTCAMLLDGSVKCWGTNYFGELGIPTAEENVFPHPQEVQNLPSPATVLDVGMNHTCVITDSADAYCWGVNYNGELGIGVSDFDPHPVPTKVVNLQSNLVDISAGYTRTCVLSDNGGVHCWGGSSNQHTPESITGLESGVAQISSGGSLEYMENHTCALMEETGGVKCWGYNNYSQLGDGTYGFFGESTPVDVLGVTGNAISVHAGALSNCVLFGSGAAACWGFDYQIETLPVNLVEVNELDLPPSIFFSNYYEGAPESYFVITGLYFPPNQTVKVFINDDFVGSILANETGVFKFFTYFDNVGQYVIRVETSQPQTGISTISRTSDRDFGQGSLTVEINEFSIRRIKEGDGLTLGKSKNSIYLPLLLK